MSETERTTSRHRIDADDAGRKSGWGQRERCGRLNRIRILGIAALVFITLGPTAVAVGQEQPGDDGTHPNIRLFFTALSPDDDVAEEALDQIAAQWRDGYAGIILGHGPLPGAAAAIRRRRARVRGRRDESDWRHQQRARTTRAYVHEGVAAAHGLS